MLRISFSRFLLSLFMVIILAFSCFGNALATEYDLRDMTDEELLSLQDELTSERAEINAALTAIAMEIENRSKTAIQERFDKEFPEGYIDTTLELYEGVYQSYSVEAKMFGDKSYFVVKDGYMFEYVFPYGQIGGTYIVEYDLIPYEGTTTTIYTDRDDYIDYTTGMRSSIYSSGVSFKTDEEGNQFLNLFDWSSRDDRWKLASAYSTYYKVDNVTQEDLDDRYYQLVGRPDPSIGMTADQVRNSTWGSPKEINKSTYSWGTKEQWVYSDYRYIYLENGIVTSIHD